jgi:hypothetical protein
VREVSITSDNSRMGNVTSSACISSDSRPFNRLAATARQHVSIVVLVLLVGASLVGCQSFVEGMQQAERDRVTRYWKPLDTDLNRGLGRHKDDMVRAIGIPSNCMALSQGSELCEWVKSGVRGGGGHGATNSSGYYYLQTPIQSWEDRIALTLDSSGLVREWTYAGRLGRRSSRDSRIGNRHEEYRPSRTPVRSGHSEACEPFAGRCDTDGITNLNIEKGKSRWYR